MKNKESEKVFKLFGFMFNVVVAISLVLNQTNGKVEVVANLIFIMLLLWLSAINLNSYINLIKGGK